MRVSTRWEVAEAPAEEVEKLARDLQILPLLARFVWNRGSRDAAAAREYLNAQLRDLGDPFLIPNMKRAAERALVAIEGGESIVLYGDYDVDGVTSVAMMKRVLDALGAAKVRCFLPDRFDEGYGLTPGGVARCLSDGNPDVLIVLDCGTNSVAEISKLQKEGVDVLVLDHHEPSTPAEPHALVNYKLAAGEREEGTGDRGQEAGDRGQEAGDRGQEAGDRGQGTGGEKLELPTSNVESSFAKATADRLPTSNTPASTAPAHPSSLIPHPCFSEYCTAGLVFKFCHALLKLGRERGLEKAAKVDLKSFLDLVALATVADIAPLTGENRILARHGLRQMAKTECVGLRALMQVAKMTKDPTTYDCGFKLGPRLNASGRLESAMASLNLLLGNDEKEAKEIARDLDETNRERQAEEFRVATEARADAELQFLDERTRVIVVARAGWHEGVVGIVASRICREFHLPTFVIALDAEGKGKGSGRSIEGFNLAIAVEATRGFLLRGGGHAMAAGVSLEGVKLDAWREALQVHARKDQGLDAERLRRIIRVDAEVTLPQLTMEFVESLEKLEPCGIGNPRPLLVARKVEIAVEPKKVGAEGKHLKLWLGQEGVKLDAIAFGRGGMIAGKGMRLDVVFEPEINEYQGKRSVQLNIKEVSEPA